MKTNNIPDSIESFYKLAQNNQIHLDSTLDIHENIRLVICRLYDPNMWEEMEGLFIENMFKEQETDEES